MISLDLEMQIRIWIRKSERFENQFGVTERLGLGGPQMNIWHCWQETVVPIKVDTINRFENKL